MKVIGSRVWAVSMLALLKIELSWPMAESSGMCLVSQSRVIEEDIVIEAERLPKLDLPVLGTNAGLLV